MRAVAYANGGKLRVRTDQEQQLWSECSRLLANCIIYYNACILSELLERAERQQDYQRADAIVQEERLKCFFSPMRATPLV